jgi:hypothetical protein
LSDKSAAKELLPVFTKILMKYGVIIRQWEVAIEFEYLIISLGVEHLLEA